MKYRGDLVFWCDISIVALESMMSLSGDTDAVQYLKVRNRTELILENMQKQGFTKDSLQSHIAKFLQVREDFIGSEMSAKVEVDLIPAILVLCA